MPILAVAPHWGAWIEIRGRVPSKVFPVKSHPTGVRGLKSLRLIALVLSEAGRTPLGCVD